MGSIPWRVQAPRVETTQSLPLGQWRRSEWAIAGFNERPLAQVEMHDTALGEVKKIECLAGRASWTDSIESVSQRIKKKSLTLQRSPLSARQRPATRLPCAMS